MQQPLGRTTVGRGRRAAAASASCTPRGRRRRLRSRRSGGGSGGRRRSSSRATRGRGRRAAAGRRSSRARSNSSPPPQRDRRPGAARRGADDVDGHLHEAEDAAHRGAKVANKDGSSQPQRMNIAETRRRLPRRGRRRARAEADAADRIVPNVLEDACDGRGDGRARARRGRPCAAGRASEARRGLVGRRVQCPHRDLVERRPHRRRKGLRVEARRISPTVMMPFCGSVMRRQARWP